jgi:hypothetical protein
MSTLMEDLEQAFSAVDKTLLNGCQALAVLGSSDRVLNNFIENWLVVIDGILRLFGCVRLLTLLLKKFLDALSFVAGLFTSG